jgi:hypothetical protein
LALVTAAVASGGHPESAIHAGLACLIVLLLERRNPIRALSGAVLGLALSAPAWVPVVEQALLSTRAAALANAPHGAMDPLLLWLFLNPEGFGNPARGTWQWISNYSVVAPTYVGLVTIALVLAVRRRRDWLLLGVLVGLFLVAMNWTILGRAINAVPPMTLIAQDRLRFVVLFFAAIVAARVVDEFPRIRGTLTAAAVLLAAGWLLRAKWGVTMHLPSAAGVIALALFVSIASWRPRLAPWAAAWAAVLELFVFNSGFNALTRRAWYRPSMPILEHLRQVPREEPWRIAGHDWTLLPNAAAQYGLEDIRGHDPMALASYARFFETVAADDPSSDVRRVQDVEQGALAFLGVRFLLTDPSVFPSPLWVLRYEGPDGKLYESKRWMRRFFAPRGDARIGEIVEESPTRLRVEVDADREALIASSQVDAPGWRVDGALRRVRLHDAFIGFTVPPGRHTITLRYVPRSFYDSAVVALAALVLMLVWLSARRGVLRLSSAHVRPHT